MTYKWVSSIVILLFLTAPVSALNVKSMRAEGADDHIEFGLRPGSRLVITLDTVPAAGKVVSVQIGDRSTTAKSDQTADVKAVVPAIGPGLYDVKVRVESEEATSPSKLPILAPKAVVQHLESRV